jgi:hypothetical protein
VRAQTLWFIVIIDGWSVNFLDTDFGLRKGSREVHSLVKQGWLLRLRLDVSRSFEPLGNED